jgi:hypothetical protein
MNQQEKQVIDGLFQKLGQLAAQSGPRDPEAEAEINRRAQGLPGATYYMAQALVLQQQALKQAESRLAQLKQQRGGAGQQPGGQAPSPPAQQRGGGGGFLAGAAQTALGIGGGLLIADAGSQGPAGVGDTFDAGDLFDAAEAGYEEATGDALDAGGGFDDLDLGGMEDLGFDDW